MKKNIFGGSFRRIIFLVSCVLLAFLFWFVTKYNALGELSAELQALL